MKICNDTQRFDLKIHHYPISITIAVTHFGERIKGKVAAAYSAHVSFPGGTRYYQGVGGFRNTEILYLHAIEDGISIALAYSTLEEFTVMIWVPNAGFVRSQLKHVHGWSERGGLTSSGRIPDSFETIRNVHNLKHQGQLFIQKTTSGKMPLLKKMEVAADRVAECGWREKAYEHNGLWRTWEIASDDV